MNLRPARLSVVAALSANVVSLLTHSSALAQSEPSKLGPANPWVIPVPSTPVPYTPSGPYGMRPEVAIQPGFVKPWPDLKLSPKPSFVKPWPGQDYSSELSQSNFSMDSLVKLSLTYVRISNKHIGFYNAGGIKLYFQAKIKQAPEIVELEPGEIRTLPCGECAEVMKASIGTGSAKREVNLEAAALFLIENNKGIWDFKRSEKAILSTK